MINRMKTKRITRFMAVLLGASLLIAATGEGMNKAFAEPIITEADKKKVDTELIYKEQSLKDQFKGLTTLMLRVAGDLAQSEPEAARAIKQAVDQAQRAFIDDDMDKVISCLNKGLMSMAGTEQAGVVEKLKKVLMTLQNTPMSADALDKRAKELQAFLNKVNAIKDRGEKHQRDANLAAKGKELAQQMRQLGKRLEGLIKRQEKTLGNTKELPSADKMVEKLSDARKDIRKLIKDEETLNEMNAKATPGKMLLASEKQKMLKERADKVIDKLNKISRGASAPAKAAEKAAKSTSDASGEMSKAANKLAATNARAADPHQKQAIADLKAAEKKLTEAIDKLGASSKSSLLAKKQKKLAGDTSELSKDVKSAEKKAGMGSKSDSGEKSNLDKASGSMSKASESLGEQNKKAAAGQQKKALEQMRKEAARLERLAKKLEQAAKDADQKRQAESQKATAKEAGRTAQDMKKSSKDGQPTPGQKSVAKAAKSMKQAAGKMSQGGASASSDKQGQAVEDLKKAAEELERAIKQAKAAAQEETLAKIEQILKDALARQKELTKTTSETYEKRKGDQYERTQILKLAELSDGEGAVAKKVDGALARIRAEGTTAVFPMVLEEVCEDLTNVQNLLAKKKAGPLTQSVQKGIEKSLEELVDALQKEKRRRKKKGGKPPPGGGGGGGAPPPLVPPVAELKMLLTMQSQINKRTLVLDASNRSGETAGTELKLQHKIVAKRQSRVAKTTTELNAKIKGNAPGAGMKPKLKPAPKEPKKGEGS